MANLDPSQNNNLHQNPVPKYLEPRKTYKPSAHDIIDYFPILQTGSFFVHLGMMFKDIHKIRVGKNKLSEKEIKNLRKSRNHHALRLLSIIPIISSIVFAIHDSIRHHTSAAKAKVYAKFKDRQVILLANSALQPELDRLIKKAVENNNTIGALEIAINNDKLEIERLKTELTNKDLLIAELKNPPLAEAQADISDQLNRTIEEKDEALKRVKDLEKNVAFLRKQVLELSNKFLPIQPTENNTNEIKKEKLEKEEKEENLPELPSLEQVHVDLENSHSSTPSHKKAKDKVVRNLTDPAANLDQPTTASQIETLQNEIDILRSNVLGNPIPFQLPPPPPPLLTIPDPLNNNNTLDNSDLNSSADYSMEDVRTEGENGILNLNDDLVSLNQLHPLERSEKIEKISVNTFQQVQDTRDQLKSRLEEIKSEMKTQHQEAEEEIENTPFALLLRQTKNKIKNTAPQLKQQLDLMQAEKTYNQIQQQQPTDVKLHHKKALLEACKSKESCQFAIDWLNHFVKIKLPQIKKSHQLTDSVIAHDLGFSTAERLIKGEDIAPSLLYFSHLNQFLNKVFLHYSKSETAPAEQQAFVTAVDKFCNKNEFYFYGPEILTDEQVDHMDDEWNDEGYNPEYDFPSNPPTKQTVQSTEKQVKQTQAEQFKDKLDKIDFSSIQSLKGFEFGGKCNQYFQSVKHLTDLPTTLLPQNILPQGQVPQDFSDKIKMMTTYHEQLKKTFDHYFDENTKKLGEKKGDLEKVLIEFSATFGYLVQ